MAELLACAEGMAECARKAVRKLAKKVGRWEGISIMGVGCRSEAVLQIDTLGGGGDNEILDSAPNFPPVHS